MAVDKLVDSTQLDTDLTSVANAIRTKGGTSGQLQFPAGFVSAIGAIPAGGGVNYKIEKKNRTNNSAVVTIDREFDDFILLAFLTDAPTTRPTNNYAMAYLLVYAGGNYYARSHKMFLVKQNGSSTASFEAYNSNPSSASVSDTAIKLSAYSTAYSVLGEWTFLQIELQSDFGVYNFVDAQNAINNG